MNEYQLQKIESADKRMADVISLGNHSRRTIGLLPHAAYLEAADKGTLLIAVTADKVVGYALFGLPRNEITLTHLVVDHEFRRQGLARAIVEHVANSHPNRSGIRVSCREDYNLNEMWSSLGFYPRAEKVGRGIDRAKVTIWYRNNPDHVDLFTAGFEPLIRAAVDFSTLRDLYDRPLRATAGESLALIEDHLLEKLQLVATPQLYRNVNSSPDADRRQRYLHSLDQGFVKPQCDRHQADTLAQKLLDSIGDMPSHDVNIDREVIRYLSEAAACGTDIFVTRDDDLISTYGPVSDRHLGLRILRPSDVVIRIDELSRSEIYRPSDVYGTSFTSEEVTSGLEEELAAFRDTADESRMEFLSTVRSAGMSPGSWSRTLIRDDDNRPVLLSIAGTDQDRFEVRLMRVDGRHPASPTLIRFSLFEFRRRCRDLGLPVFAITDNHLLPLARRAALLDGFVQTDEGLVALVVDCVGSASDVLTAARRAGSLANLEIDAELRPGLSRFAAAEVERTFWPAKIVDSELPTFMLPIRPEFSSMLFGIPAPLPLFRTEDWGLGREHVYYRPPGGLRLAAPARVLWYKSQGRERSEAAVIGCSLLEEVVVDAPGVLHARFDRLGVWSLHHVMEAARNGKVQALRITQTEIFRRPLAGRLLKRAFADGGLTGTVQGPRNISPHLFASIYREGTHAA